MLILTTDVWSSERLWTMYVVVGGAKETGDPGPIEAVSAFIKEID